LPPSGQNPRRSALYVPGDNARALDKARGLAADALIFDLEDSVAPEGKAAARAAVVAALLGGGFDGRERVIRVNAPATPWGADDLAAAAAARPDAILLPKIDGRADVVEAAARLVTFNAARVRLWAMIETPRGVLAAEAIAAAPRLDVLVMGLNDLAKETRVPLAPGRAAYLPWMMHCLAAARASGRDILDGVHNSIHDGEGFARECAEARALGFDGKTLIHPAQIAPCNAAFSPSEDELARARAIVDAFAKPENAGKGVVMVDGQMAERLHEATARALLAKANYLAARALASREKTV